VVTLNAESEGVRNSYWMVTAVVDPALGVGTKAIMECLLERNIDSRPFFNPLSAIPAYAHLGVAEECKERNTNSYRLSASAVNMPSGFNMTREKVAFVSGCIEEILSR